MNTLPAPDSGETSIFALADPRTNEIKFSSIVSSKLRTHILFKCYYNTIPELKAWLLDLKAQNLCPVVSILATGSLDQIISSEPSWKRAINRHYSPFA